MAYGALEKKVECPNQAWESGCPDCLPVSEICGTSHYGEHQFIIGNVQK